MLIAFGLGIGLISLGVVIWGVVDAATRPDPAWVAAGQNKVLWIVLQAVGFVVLPPAGIVLAIVYLAAVRPKVASAQVPGTRSPDPFSNERREEPGPSP